jgi:hypothetical protein
MLDMPRLVPRGVPTAHKKVSVGAATSISHPPKHDINFSQRPGN